MNNKKKIVFDISIAIVEGTDIAFYSLAVSGIPVKKMVTRYPEDKKFHWILGVIHSLIKETKIKQGDIEIKFFFQDYGKSLETNIRTTKEVVEYLKARDYVFHPESKRKLHRILSLFESRKYSCSNTTSPETSVEIGNIRRQAQIHNLRTYIEFKEFNSPEEVTAFG